MTNDAPTPATVAAKPHTRRRVSLRSRLLLLIPAFIIIAFDQWVKAWALRTLPEYQTVELISWLRPVVVFTSIRNTGVAFGLFPQLGTVFAIVNILVVLLILIFQRTVPGKAIWVHLALGFVSGGTIGNVIDRLTRGYVVDFLDFNFWPLHQWPIFNIADSCIVIGVTILLIDSLFTDYSSDAPADKPSELPVNANTPES